MTIFTRDDAYDDTHFPATSRRKRYFKEDQKGVSEVCEIMQMIKNDGIAEGISQGITQGQQQLILQMYHDGDINLSLACKHLNISEEEFLALESSIDN